MSTHACRSALAVLAATALLTGCSSLRQTLQNRPCVLEANAPYDVVAIDPMRHEIALYWRNPASGEPFARIGSLLAYLESQGDSVIAITNAGIFEKNLTPAGLYIERSLTLNPINLADGYGNFYLKPNGIFYITPYGAAIIDASQFSTQEDSATFAIQSGPLLLLDGRVHPAFMPGSVNCRLRSGIGVDPESSVFVAISNGAVNFHDFAMYFRENLGVQNALYLDGAISTLYAPPLGRTRQSGKRYGAFLVVRPKR